MYQFPNIITEEMYRKQVSQPPIKKSSVKPIERMPSAVNQRKNSAQELEPKSKQEQLLSYVREYLQLNGYVRTCQTLKNQKAIKSRAGTVSCRPSGSTESEQKVLAIAAFEKGVRDEFFKLTGKHFATSEQTVRKLQFELQVYFCIYSIHPNCKKQQAIDKASSQAFKKFLDSKGAQLSNTSEYLSFFALPFMHKPQEVGALAHVFTKDWIVKLKYKLTQFLGQQLRSSNSSFKNSHPSVKKISTLQEIFYNSMGTISESRASDCKENCNHLFEIQELKDQNRELRAYIQNLQSHFKQFTQSSKMNLIQSNKKWFSFSKQILILAKRAERGQKIKQIQKYERFFGGNVDQHMQANEISLFEKNSYLGQEASMARSISKDHRNIKKKQNPSASQIDMQKIRHLFLQGSHKQKQIEVCLVLKALKDRYVNLKSSIKRREVLIEYSRTDVCGIKDENYEVQKQLLLQSVDKIKVYFLKFMNQISIDVVGIQYLTKSEKLIQNLIGLFGNEDEYSSSRKYVLGILQRFSYSKAARTQMISFGIIPMIFMIFRNEKEQLSVFTIQYLIALMMNLSQKRDSIKQFQRHKSQLFAILSVLIGHQSDQIRNYANGTLYLLLSSKILRGQAQKQHLKEKIESFLQEKSEGLYAQQYEYILKRLAGEEEVIEDEQYSSDEEDEEVQVYQGLDDEDDEDEKSLSDSSSSEDNDWELEYLHGEELLMKQFALLGPDAVREHMLTRSVLDQTSKRMNNLTTSINRSRRLDNIFVQKHNATALEPELGNLLNRDSIKK